MHDILEKKLSEVPEDFSIMLMHFEVELKKLHGTKWRKVTTGLRVNDIFEYTVIGHEYTVKNCNGTNYPHKIYMQCIDGNGRQVSYLYENLIQLEQVNDEKD